MNIIMIPKANESVCVDWNFFKSAAKTIQSRIFRKFIVLLLMKASWTKKL